MSFEFEVFQEIEANKRKLQEAENIRLHQETEARRKQNEREEAVSRDSRLVYSEAIEFRDFLIAKGVDPVFLPGVRITEVEKTVPDRFFLNFIGLTIDAYREGIESDKKPRTKTVTEEVILPNEGWLLTQEFLKIDIESRAMDSYWSDEYSDGSKGVAILTDGSIISYRMNAYTGSNNGIKYLQRNELFDSNLPNPAAWHRLFVQTAVELTQIK